jgi:glycosyltransferase involved in cell wall biosynthesis
MELKFPQISVILPVYNRRNIIERALKSIDLQKFADYELLIIDDGSTDGLEELIFPEIQKRQNWRYLKHKNRKVAWTRNIGIHAALGKYVTFLDSDDEYLPDHLQLRFEFMEIHPEIDLIHGGFKLVGSEKSFWVVDVRDQSKLIHIKDCCVGATLFAKKSLFLSEGGFPIVSYSPEFHFLHKVEKKYRVEKVDFPTYLYHTSGSDRICYDKIINENDEDGNL